MLRHAQQVAASLRVPHGKRGGLAARCWSRWLARFMEGPVYGVDTRDPLTLGAVCLTLIAVGVVASLGQARRATSVDPVIALRNG